MHTFISQISSNKWLSKYFSVSFKTDSQFPIITQVVGLSLYQAQYIYHHIHVGTFLNVQYNFDALTQDSSVEIYYKGFKLGHLPQHKSLIIAKVLLHGFEIEARVLSIEKKKYMPIHGMEIEISDKYL